MQNESIPDLAAVLSDLTDIRSRIQQLEARLSNHEQFIQQQARQITALVNAQPKPINLPLDGFQVPPQRNPLDRLRLRTSNFVLKLRAKSVARLLYPRSLRAYEGQILGCSLLRSMVVGAIYEGVLVVENLGKGIWYTPQRTPYCLNVSYHWLDKRGRMAVKEGIRTPLPREIMPGERAIVPFQIVAPKTPGTYYLQADLVHEGVRWLGELQNFPSYPVEVVAP